MIIGRLIIVVTSISWSALIIAEVAVAAPVMTMSAGSGKRIVLTPRAFMTITVVPAI